MAEVGLFGTQDIEKLEFEYTVWPTAWKDEEDDRTEGANLDVLLSNAHKREKYWESVGVPYRRVISDGHGKLKYQSQQWASLLAAESDQHDDRLDTEYVALSRAAAVDQPGKETVYSHTGDRVQGVDWVIVPVSDVPILQAEGWELSFAPTPAFEVNRGYNDLRKFRSQWTS
ncbi:hypothetical protein CMQ_5517 [Grosmannia clavigera kw1407]|uniref:Uncharacterized protein n=1 Tax=Grosmannia clavigera (strain kw1407 / UAMH 11150) TaxID=655863 RepID=F0XSK1_GROCL|nr:uncharacterized protein CMQ_5517 [Grosmannia clavigera kw1407]EFW99096.1 hypothetical protein CMQ_5517 [Grosmannia clavigera kw1407]